MKTIHFQVPDDVDLKDYEYTMTIAAKLYEGCSLSSGQSARVAGLFNRAFIELLGRYRVSVLSSSLSDLRSDIANNQISMGQLFFHPQLTSSLVHPAYDIML